MDPKNTPGNAHEYNAYAKKVASKCDYRIGSHNIKAETLQELS